jgi:hypothetical protein
MSEQSPLGDVIQKVEESLAQAHYERKQLDYHRERRATAFYISLAATLLTAIFYVLVADHPENTVLSVAFGLLLAAFIFMWGRVVFLGSLYYKQRSIEKNACDNLDKTVANLAMWKTAL